MLPARDEPPPSLDRTLQALEVAREEVVAPVDHVQLPRLGKRLDECADGLAPAEAVVLALDEQPRLGHGAHEGRLGEAGHGEAEREHRRRSCVARSDAQGHHRSEGEPAQDQRQPGEAALQRGQGGAHVVLLSDAVVVSALRETHAAKVEAEGREPFRLQCLGGPEDDLEVHHPALKRMRMTDEGRGHWRCLGMDQEGLEAPGRAAHLEGFVLRHTRECMRAWRGASSGRVRDVAPRLPEVETQETFRPQSP